MHRLKTQDRMQLRIIKLFKYLCFLVTPNYILTEVSHSIVRETGQVLFTKTCKIIDGKIFNDIMDVWLFEYDGEVYLGNATTDEVAQAAWMNGSQIKELSEEKMFVDALKYFFTEVDKERR